LERYLDAANELRNSSMKNRNLSLAMLALGIGVLAAIVALALTVSPVFVFVLGLALPFIVASIAVYFDSDVNQLSAAMHTTAQNINSENYTKADSVFSFFHSDNSSETGIDEPKFTVPDKSAY